MIGDLGTTLHLQCFPSPQALLQTPEEFLWSGSHHTVALEDTNVLLEGLPCFTIDSMHELKRNERRCYVCKRVFVARPCSGLSQINTSPTKWLNNANRMFMGGAEGFGLQEIPICKSKSFSVNPVLPSSPSLFLTNPYFRNRETWSRVTAA